MRDITREFVESVMRHTQGILQGFDPAAFVWVFVTKLDQNDMRARICNSYSVFPRVSGPSEVIKILESLLDNDHCSGVVIACDTSTEGNAPSFLGEWDKEMYRKGAIMGDTAWTMMFLSRSLHIRYKFLSEESPKKLLFAVIDGENIDILELVAQAALTTFKKSLSPDNTER